MRTARHLDVLWVVMAAVVMVSAPAVARGADWSAPVDSIGNLGWIGGAPSASGRASGASMNLSARPFVELGRHQGELREHGMKLTLSRLALGVVGGGATRVSRLLGIDYGVSGEISGVLRKYENLSYDKNMCDAGLMAGPECGLCIGPADGLRIRPFLMVGMAVEYLGVGEDLEEEVNVDHVGFGAAWKVGLEIIPKHLPLSLVVGRTNWYNADYPADGGWFTPVWWEDSANVDGGKHKYVNTLSVRFRIAS
jgi:hypothetical protein